MDQCGKFECHISYVVNGSNLFSSVYQIAMSGASVHLSMYTAYRWCRPRPEVASNQNVSNNFHVHQEFRVVNIEKPLKMVAILF